jgi:hypothetical protein
MYDYLVGMEIWKLSMEDKDKMLAQSEAKQEELRVLKGKTWSDLWEEDLRTFEEALKKQVTTSILLHLMLLKFPGRKRAP